MKGRTNEREIQLPMRLCFGYPYEPGYTIRNSDRRQLDDHLHWYRKQIYRIVVLLSKADSGGAVLVKSTAGPQKCQDVGDDRALEVYVPVGRAPRLEHGSIALDE